MIRDEIKTKRACEKLSEKRLGPFRIVRVINDVAFQLDLPANSQLHPVFHTSFLAPYTPNDIPNRRQPPPPPYSLDDDGEELYEVDHIVDARRNGNSVEYLLHWKGYDKSDRTWEPHSHILEGTQLLRQAAVEFHRQNPNKPRPPCLTRG